MPNRKVLREWLYFFAVCLHYKMKWLPEIRHNVSYSIGFFREWSRVICNTCVSLPASFKDRHPLIMFGQNRCASFPLPSHAFSSYFLTHTVFRAWCSFLHHCTTWSFHSLKHHQFMDVYVANIRCGFWIVEGAIFRVSEPSKIFK